MAPALPARELLRNTESITTWLLPPKKVRADPTPRGCWLLEKYDRATMAVPLVISTAPVDPVFDESVALPSSTNVSFRVKMDPENRMVFALLSGEP